jgi:deazaflavin-dependent oxidoreductase (nitroreductase family)
MTDSDFLPSPTTWVRKQVETIEATGDTRSVHVLNRTVVMLTMRGAKTGGDRKVPLMRVEHDGVYAAVASKGGAPEHPQWYRNLVVAASIFAALRERRKGGRITRERMGLEARAELRRFRRRPAGE